jgi:excisionase family DNA binding protein
MRRAWFRVCDDDADPAGPVPIPDCPCCGRPSPFARERSGIVLSSEEAAVVLGVSRPTIVRLIQSGWIHGSKRGRAWHVNLDEVVRVLALEASRRARALDDIVRSRRGGHRRTDDVHRAPQ